MTGYDLILKMLNDLKELEGLDPPPLTNGKTREQVLRKAGIEYELKKIVLEECLRGLGYGDLSREGGEECKDRGKG